MSTKDTFWDQMLEVRQRLMDLGLTEEGAMRHALHCLREQEPELYEQLKEWTLRDMLQETLLSLAEDGKIELKLAKRSDGDYEWQLARLVQ